MGCLRSRGGQRARAAHRGARARGDAGGPERFVFHQAARSKGEEARRSIERARSVAVERAARALEGLKKGRDVCVCAIVAKRGAMPELAAVLASHPKLHAGEGLFYRDVLLDAARSSGLTTRIVPPSELDLGDPALVVAGHLAGTPWSRDWKTAALAAWHALR